MKLLIHTCCAPCSISLTETAKQAGYDDITGFFYNPNIHPAAELKKRFQITKNYFSQINIKSVDCDNDYGDFFYGIKRFDESNKRCMQCWALRVNSAASFAARNDIEYFTTTLLASPYQDHNALKAICEAASMKYKVNFFYRDFRADFKRSHIIARKMGMYCQGYCGCVFSVQEKYRKKRL